MMDLTDAKRLFIGQKGLIPEGGVEHHVPRGQRAQPWREPGFVPHEVLVHLQAEPPGRVPGGIVHEIIRIIPAAGGEPHTPRGGEPPVLGAIVLILRPAKLSLKLASDQFCTRRNP